jgi:hypothetical protein
MILCCHRRQAADMFASRKAALPQQNIMSNVFVHSISSYISFPCPFSLCKVFPHFHHSNRSSWQGFSLACT